MNPLSVLARLRLRLLLRLLALSRNKWLALDGTELTIRHDHLWPLLDGGDVVRLIGDNLLQVL